MSEEFEAELAAGEGIGLPAIGRLAPMRVCGPTVFRWATRGIKLPSSGRRVYLESVRCGHRLVSTAGALKRFTAATTAGFIVGAEPIRSPAAQSRASKKAEAELRKLGV